MGWEMELEEIEAALEKIWDLHDKLSDAIHAISRSHFLNSIKARKKSEDFVFSRAEKDKRIPRVFGDDEPSGFVFVKDFRIEDDMVISEAKSLNAIRTALENLEDQLEFFHAAQSQQQAEREAAITRLEQSRIILAMRLADHHGRKYKVLEEAQAFIGDVHSASRFVEPGHLFQVPRNQTGDDLEGHVEKRSSFFMQTFKSVISFVKQSLKLNQVGGVVGNAALIALGMVALLQLHQAALRSDSVLQRKDSKYSDFEDSSVDLDVLSARG